MMSVVNRVGRLAEVRYVPPLKHDELVNFMGEVRRLVEAAPEPLLFVCDWRAIDEFDSSFADTIVWIMRRDNPRIAANAMLVRTAKLEAQAERIVADASNPRRRVFVDESALAGWIDPQLTVEERERRKQFLAEGPRGSSMSMPAVRG